MRKAEEVIPYFHRNERRKKGLRMLRQHAKREKLHTSRNHGGQCKPLLRVQKKKAGQMGSGYGRGDSQPPHGKGERMHRLTGRESHQFDWQNARKRAGDAYKTGNMIKKVGAEGGLFQSLKMKKKRRGSRRNPREVNNQSRKYGKKRIRCKGGGAVAVERRKKHK